MKRSLPKMYLGYLMLALYSMVLLKPAFTVVNDFVEHVFNEYEHIATVHYENGSYHLHQELAADEETKSAEQRVNHFENFQIHLLVSVIVEVTTASSMPQNQLFTSFFPDLIWRMDEIPVPPPLV